MTNFVPAARSRSASSWNSRDRQDQPEVRHRTSWPSTGLWTRCGAAGREVRDELVAVQVPVDPGVGAAALLEAEHLAVEAAGGVEVVDRHGEVEAGDGGVSVVMGGLAFRVQREMDLKPRLSTLVLSPRRGIHGEEVVA